MSVTPIAVDLFINGLQQAIEFYFDDWVSVSREINNGTRSIVNLISNVLM